MLGAVSAGCIMSFLFALVRPRLVGGFAGSRMAFSRPPLTLTPRFTCADGQRRYFSVIFMSADDVGGDGDDTKTADSVWDVNGLKKETQRQVLRCHKKVGKASQRLMKAKEEVDRLTGDENVSLEELEKCPDVDALEQDLQVLRSRLGMLNDLESQLGAEKKGKRTLPASLAKLIINLGVDDSAPKAQPRGPKKKKGPRGNPESTRLPYRRYFSQNRVEIRVGKQAEDNDQLSLSPEHRDSADWWMHASGCPGSHVVIRCHDGNLDTDLVQDAAALAARQSKCHGATIKVSLTRCRDVSKPPGAKAGLVQLTGSVTTVSVTMKDAEKRLQRLDETCLIN